MNVTPIGKEIVLPSGEIAPLSAAFKAGDYLFLSGQLPMNDSGQIYGESIIEQTKICLRNIDSILSLEKLDRKNIVKLTVFLTDEKDFPAFNKAYSEFFGKHRPARSTIKCELLIPDAKIEIEAVAAY